MSLATHDPVDVHVDLDISPSLLTLNAVAVPLFVLNGDGVILVENTAARDLMGTASATLRGHAFAELAVRESDRRRLRTLMAAIRQTPGDTAPSSVIVQWPQAESTTSEVPSEAAPPEILCDEDASPRQVRCTIRAHTSATNPLSIAHDHKLSSPSNGDDGPGYDAPNAPLFVVTVEDQSTIRALQDVLTRISDEERRRIGEDMHDLVASRLTVMSIRLQNLQNRMRARGDTDYAESIVPILDTIQSAASRVRTISHALCPVELQDTPLVEALKHLVTSLDEVHQPALSFSSAGLKDQIFPEDVRTHMFRIAHEAIHNAVKHARASWIRVDLSRIDHRCRLSVWDDGVGVSSDTSRSDDSCGIGQRLMHCRADLMGATLSIDVAPNGGTLLQVDWPIPETERSRA